MAEAAGLVLGGFPVVMWAIERYRKPIESYFKYETTLSTLRDNVFLQQEQLQSTFRSIGLMNPSLEEVRQALMTIFPHKHTEFVSIIGQMDKIMSRLMRDLDIDMEGKPLWTNDPPDRVKWEWRRVKRALGSRERKDIIGDLQYWNMGLKNCVEKVEIPLDDEDYAVQRLRASFNPRECDETRDDARSMHRALEASLQCHCVASHQIALEVPWLNESLDRRRNTAFCGPFALALSYLDNSSRSPQAPSKWKRVQVKAESQATMLCESESQASSLKERGSHAGTAILRNRLGHSSRHGPRQFWFGSAVDSPLRNAPSSPKSPDDTRISSLCTKIEQAGPACVNLGYLSDPNQSKSRQFCVSQNPQDIHNLIRLLPIRSILSNNGNIGGQQQAETYPASAARQRYGIAAATAYAVLYLSGTPWFEEPWDQKQVNVFLESTDTGHKLLSQFPSISCTFQTSAGVPTPSSADSFQGNQIRNKTIFALGIILIELCLDTSFDELRRQLPGSQSEPLDDYAIAIAKVDNVYLQAGDSYGYAVQRCLRCEFLGRDVTKNLEFAQFRRHFYNGVVAPVQAVYTRLPASCAAL